MSDPQRAPALETLPPDVVALADFERHAQARMTPEAWAFLNGGAADELTLRANRAAWDALQLMPRVLRDLSGGHTRVRLLGREMPLPGVGDRVQVAARGAQGRVAGMAPVGDGSAGMRVRVALERAGDLRVGESVTALLALAGADAVPSGESAGGSGGTRLRVPAAALAHWNNRAGVFVATGQGVRFMPLSVEASDEATAVVRGTLPPKARIAVTGIAALKGLLGGGE